MARNIELFMVLIMASLLGIFLSLYLLHVKKMAGKRGYRPFCDISERISCSKAVKSPYAYIFRSSNAVIGLVFYVAVGFLGWLGLNTWIFLLSIPSLIMTFYLIYISFVRIKVFCIVCNATYLLNFFITAYSAYMIFA